MSFTNFLWEQETVEHLEFTQKLRNKELVENLADTTSQVDQLQQNLFENKKKKKLPTIQELENKNFENMIFKTKLVPLLLDRHFALATSFQLYGYKAWKEFREASMEIIFYKMMRDKKLRHQLRREQLDYKDLWSGNFKALCLSNFEDSSFADSNLEEETFEEGNFEDSSLEDSNFEENNLEESSLEQNSFEESSLEQSSLEESSLEPSNFEDSNLDEENFSNSSFDRNSFQESSLRDSSFQEDNLANKSFQRPASTTELSQLQRRTSTTELSQLQKRTLTTELAALERTTLHTELAQLECKSFRQRALTKATSSLALESPASSFELSPAQLCYKEASLGTLAGALLKTAACRGGSAKLPACLP